MTASSSREGRIRVRGKGRTHLQSRVIPFEIRVDEDVASRESELRVRVPAPAAALPDGERIVRMTERMSARELADVTIANLPCSIDDKARYAAEPSVEARLDLLLAILDRAA